MSDSRTGCQGKQRQGGASKQWRGTGEEEEEGYWTHGSHGKEGSRLMSRCACPGAVVCLCCSLLPLPRGRLRPGGPRWIRCPVSHASPARWSWRLHPRNLRCQHVCAACLAQDRVGIRERVPSPGCDPACHLRVSLDRSETRWADGHHCVTVSC
jgi:hypothetical protein